jgi:hypothetical protein
VVTPQINLMLDFKIRFDFHRFAEGYALEPKRTELAGSAPEVLIVPKGRAPPSHLPFEKFDMLYSAFAKVRTQDELLAFVERFGLLMGRGGDSVVAVLREAQFFRDLLASRRKNRKKVAACFQSQLRIRLAAEYQKVNLTLPPNAELWEWQAIVGNCIDLENVLCHSVARIELIPDTKRGVQLQITAETLLAALWWQLARKLSGDSEIRECRHCGEWFEVGAGTTRRADAEFCSRDHKIRFFSLKRSRGG